ncbi:MAG TPA: aspartate carbamoyltransferase catalytic subunit [Terriglobales bacterium]|nr:aspartate carbamoyltransferase catalytic subunit [Terriglobales bacterium]
MNTNSQPGGLRRGLRSLLDIEHLPAEEIQFLLRLARRMVAGRARPLLRNRRIALLFYEASTRTRVSFEFAAKALGATTTVIHAQASSIEKGESLADTGHTLRATGADAIVLRHPAAGAPHLLARHLDIPVINAGDGMHEHPSQALLDAFTILRHRKSLAGLRVAIVGDIYHSRVARSNAHLLSKFSAQVTLCGPPELAPEVAATLAPGVRITRHMEDALRGADVVMMLRVQKERLKGRSIRVADYIAGYQLTPERMKLARRDALVMHPGPMIRGMELTNEVADGPQSVIREQVQNGVAMRMAILARCLGAAR